MHVSVVTPPDPVVTVDEAKAHLRVDFGDDDDLITGLVAAATALLDGPDGVLNRALGPQVLEATIEGFPRHGHGGFSEVWDRHRQHRRHRHGLALRCLPIGAVSEVTYIDATGSEQTLDPSVYVLTADGRLRLAFGQCWPAVRSFEDPVTITYSAGYEALPAPLRSAILLMVGDLYENRDAQIISESRATAVANVTAERLIAPYLVRRA